MRHKMLCILVAAMGLCFTIVAAAQNPPNQSEATNPPIYSNPPPVEPTSPQATPVQNRDIPADLTLPAGTLLRVRLIDMLSSDRNNAGDSFTAEIDQPIILEGWVVSRRSQTAVGQVVAAQKAKQNRGVSLLAIELNELVLVDGYQTPIRTQLIQSSTSSPRGHDAAVVGTTAGIGAAIGAATRGGEGAIIGAAAGAVAGIVGVMSTRGRATELYPETILTFRLEDPVTISTQKSQQAFKPVSQQDYIGNNMRRDTIRNSPPVEVYPRPYYYPPYYYSPYWNSGYYGFGLRIYSAPRMYFGSGHNRRHR